MHHFTPTSLTLADKDHDSSGQLGDVRAGGTADKHSQTNKLRHQLHTYTTAN
jgi:hypothetical protein